MHTTILLFVALLPFLPALNLAAGVDFSSVRLAAAGLGGSIALRGLVRRRLSLPLTPAIVCVAGFIAVASVSFLWAADPSFALRKAAFFLSLLPVTLVVAACDVAPLRLLRAASIGAAASAIAGLAAFLAQFRFGADAVAAAIASAFAPRLWGIETADAVVRFPSWYVDIGGRAVLRAFLPFPDPHTAALLWGMGLFVTFGAWPTANRQKTRPLRFLLSAIRSLLVAAVLLSFTRGGYVALLAASAAYGVWRMRSADRKAVLRNAMATIGIAILFAGTVGQPVLVRFLSAFTPHEGSAAARLELWRDAGRVFLDYPLLGAGLGSFAVLENTGASYRDPTNAHSTYLEIAAELGMVGAALFLAAYGFALAAAVRAARRGSPSHAGIAGALSFFAFHAVFETDLYSPANFTLLLMLLTLATTNGMGDANQPAPPVKLRD